MTMLNSNNRKLIVGSEKLFLSNQLATMFSKDHDILLFSYDDKLNPKDNSRMIWRTLSKMFAKEYDKIVFMGLGSDCNVLQNLYKDRGLAFDAGVLVNYTKIDSESIVEKDSAKKIWSFSNKKRPEIVSYNHQSLPWYYTIRSKRLAQEIYGTIVYGVYDQTYLDGDVTEFYR